jgi:hypothetical protein
MGYQEICTVDERFAVTFERCSWSVEQQLKERSMHDEGNRGREIMRNGILICDFL